MSDPPDGGDRAVQVSPLRPEQFGEAVALIAVRLPAQTRTEVGLPFESPGLFQTRVLHGATDARGRLIGVGLLLRPSFAPVHRSSLRAVVAREHEGQGVGTALRSSLLSSSSPCCPLA